MEANCQQQQQQNICNKYWLIRLDSHFIPQKTEAKSCFWVCVFSAVPTLFGDEKKHSYVTQALI